ncbi:hypothetical protein [Lysinibacillus sp. OL1]|uniref:hypothetical protein n=1 Tax=Lysinibacillus sp. OL1 TaxID=2517243 RepID=UPI00103863E0|nr:hypothetical protein [Lysinibacillus sp. OL1]TBV87400.1 hypothetical protein EW028_13050 [Lysinibacillus sp. OL1]
MSFLIDVGNHETIEDVVDRIDSIEGIAVGELNFSMEELLRNGIYIIKENENVVYVGKATSRIFLERFAGHFDTRKGGGFNNLLKTIAKSKGNTDSDEDLKNVWRTVLNFKIVCVALDPSREHLLKKWEDLLMIHYNEYHSLYNRTIWNVKYDYGYDLGDEVDVLRNGVMTKFKIEGASSRYGMLIGRYRISNDRWTNPQKLNKNKIIESAN